MRSAWFWGTDMWAQYQAAYRLTRPEPESYKTSPLAEDHCIRQALDIDDFNIATHRTQVIDLTLSLEDLWRGVRKSYRPLINKAQKEWEFKAGTLTDYHRLHTLANGRETRSQDTWDCMGKWMADGFGGLVMATEGDIMGAGAYFIIYQGGAYYASGASIVDNVQHAVIWTAIKRLKACGVRLLELGQIDGETEKEQNIGVFKSGFGGKAMPFTVATRRTT